MNATTVNRILLLAILPLIIAVLYLEGQNYNPALVRFTASDISPGGVLLPKEIGVYTQAGAMRLFSRENLYEYVNGHAEYFLAAGFENLVVSEYSRAENATGQPDVVVDLYDMGKPLYAMGILTDEVGGKPTTLNIGVIGAKTAQGISFVSGKYYIKIAAFHGEAPVELFASDINTAIGGSTERITAFARFPDLEGAQAPRYIKESYRGLDFADNVVEREYRIGESAVQVSLHEGSALEIQDLLAAYLAFFQNSEIDYDQVRRGDRLYYKIIDPFEGDWYLIPLQDALFGIYGMKDAALLNRFLALLMPMDPEKDKQEGNTIKPGLNSEP